MIIYQYNKNMVGVELVYMLNNSLQHNGYGTALMVSEVVLLFTWC